MFKRTRWMVLGYGLGATTSYVAARRLRRAAKRYTPNEVANRVGAAVDGTSRLVSNAMTEGRETMRDRESELRSAHHIESGARRRIRTI
jgi:TATA-binding protein-associated factor Taf7